MPLAGWVRYGWRATSGFAGSRSDALAAVGIFFMQRGAHLDLLGSILNVRTLPINENSSAAIIDFRFRNPSDYVFKVQRVEVTMTDSKGNVNDGSRCLHFLFRAFSQWATARSGRRGSRWRGNVRFGVAKT